MDSHAVKSLRCQLEKWLARTPGVPMHLTRFIVRRRRCVRVESIQERGVFVIFFFQQDDGSWGVFPPSPAAPTMRAHQYAV